MGDSVEDIVEYYKTEEKCNYYSKRNVTFVFYKGYGYVPETFLIDIVIWIVMMLTFSVLRKKAWNYGRLALVQNEEEDRWTRIFYGESEAEDKESESSAGSVDSTKLDPGFFSWMFVIFRLKDEQILKRSGLDSVQYLSFQRHIIGFLGVVCIISLTVILPINVQGTLEDPEKKFARTTISNLDPSSELLWAHVVLAFLLMPIGVLFMRHFSKNLKFFEDDNSVPRAIMILHVPKTISDRALVKHHFREAYPDLEVEDIQLSYKVARLIQLHIKRKTIEINLRWCENYLAKNGERVQMTKYPNACGWMRCTRMQAEFDAIEYYNSELEKLSEEIEQENIKVVRNPAGIAFVTFKTEEMARRLYDDYHKFSECCRSTPSSSLTKELESYAWEVRHAPEADDIKWENLHSNVDYWYIRWFAVNVVLFLVLFFLTTPFIIVNSVNLYYFTKQIPYLSSLLTEYLPALLLLTFASLMPVIVSFSDRLLQHWTESSYNHSVMRKTYTFLLFMVIILPSLGLTSGKAFVDWIVEQNNQTAFRWECVFLPDNGAFFVNYVIASCFLGNSVELLRMPELLLYILGLLSARNIAERANVKKTALFNFAFGVNYSWMMLNVAMTLIYCVICPLITPFGLLYAIMKHGVDRYNIYFAYAPSKINRKIHFTAINFLIVNIILMQILLLYFLSLRSGTVWKITNASAIVIVSTLGCIAVLIMFGIQLCFNVVKSITAIGYKKIERGDLIFGILGDTGSNISGASLIKYCPDVVTDITCGEPFVSDDN